MATYDRLVFSQEVFKDEMNKLCDEALNEAVKEIQTNEWFYGTTPVYKDMEGYDSYIEVYANHLKAWIVEYGLGSEMRTDNPYLEEYKNSKYYSPLRKRYADNSVVFRGKGKYEQLDYEKGHGTVTREGAEPAGERMLMSIPPDPFLEDLMSEAWQVFERTFNSMVASFDFNICFITVQEHA